jgi:Resolvase, N terminal domain
MAVSSCPERMKAARAAASAQRKAEQAAWQREIELRCEVRRLAREAVLTCIKANGDKVSLYTQAEISAWADTFICKWLIAKAKEKCPPTADFQLTKLMHTTGAEMIVGYARVSTDGQTLDAQQVVLREAGATRLFSEKQSGAKTDRRELARCLASLEPGDIVLLTKLDRLARSTRDLLNTLAAIAEAGASFKSLGDPWADTTTPHGRLMDGPGRAGGV